MELKQGWEYGLYAPATEMTYGVSEDRAEEAVHTNRVKACMNPFK